MSLFGPFRAIDPGTEQDTGPRSRWHWARPRLGPFLILLLVGSLLATGPGLRRAIGRQAAAVAEESASFTGQFLVATDDLTDPRFIRTVVYMVHHDVGGAMGLIVNRPLGDASIADLMGRLGLDKKGVTGDILVHYGGPVEPARGFVLHTAEYKIEGTQIVKDKIAITSQPEILQAIGAGAGPHRSLLALGYAGWAPGQLEAEIKAGAWVVVPADESLVFDKNYEKKWERAIARRTINL
jgi:putative transcriptional regulator